MLEEAFSIAPYKAEDLVLEMLDQGQASLGDFPIEEARTNWKRAQGMCRKEMYPLRLSVRNATRRP